MLPSDARGILIPETMDNSERIPMIDVITYSKDDYITIDRAEAETAEDAIAAARTLLEDAHAADENVPRAALYVDGQMIRCDVTLPEISDAPQFRCDWAFRNPNPAASRA